VVEAVQGVPVSATGPVAPGQVLKWDGIEASWAADAQGVDYTATLWVDPSGDPASDGLAPSKPTTLANALATVPANGLIKVEAGTYAVPPTAGITCTIVGAETAQLTGLLTITAPNIQVVGVLLQGGVSDQSSAAGATRFSECSIIGPITMASPASGQILEFNRTDFGATTVTGASGGATIRAKGCRSGTSITSTATGLVIVQLSETDVGGALTLNNAGGSMSVTLTKSSIASFVRTAGSVTGFVLDCSRVGTLASPSPIDATGAAAGTVKAIASLFDRGASTIPVSAEETTVPTRNSALEYNAASVWTPLSQTTPTQVASALDELQRLMTIYGPAHAETKRETPLITSTLPGAPPYAGASTFMSLGSALAPVFFPAGKYTTLVGYIVQVDTGGVEYWIDTFLNDSPSPAGPSNQPIGKANAQINSTFTITVDLGGPAFLWFDVKVAKGGGPTGNVIYKAAYLVIWRIG